VSICLSIRLIADCVKAAEDIFEFCSLLNSLAV